MPCFVAQTIDAARMATSDPEVQEEILRRALRQMADWGSQMPPPILAARIHNTVRDLSGCADPYLAAKQRSNRLACEVLAEIRPAVEASRDPFAAAAKLAIAANVIDLGVKMGRQYSESSVRGDMRSALGEDLPKRELEALRMATSEARSVLYLADNAGEVVFDRLLVERLPRGAVAVAVRGGPILNDALLADAEAAGLAEVAEIIDNGTAVPGTALEECPEDFRRRFEQADVVISKGQGNY